MHGYTLDTPICPHNSISFFYCVHSSLHSIFSLPCNRQHCMQLSSVRCCVHHPTRSDSFNWFASPAAASTELEMIVMMDWFAKMLKLPSSLTFNGPGGGVIIQGTTSEAILCTLVATRDRTLDRIGEEKINKLVVYGSDQTHSTFAKACKIAGIQHSNISSLPTTTATHFSLSPELLRSTLEADVAADGWVPIYVCATVGTPLPQMLNGPLEEIADVASDYNVWLLVDDAAYAGSACICPEFRHYLNGIERFDSLSLSPHKWFLTYLDCCCLWVKQPNLLTKALSTNPEYLKNKPSESNTVVWITRIGKLEPGGDSEPSDYGSSCEATVWRTYRALFEHIFGLRRCSKDL